MPIVASAKEQFLDVFKREYATTAKVIRAYPDDKLDLKPHEKSMTAKQLAWLLVQGHGMLTKAITTGFDWSTPPSALPPPPNTVAEIADALDAAKNRLLDAMRGVDDARLAGTVQFYVAPKTIRDVPTMDFLWFILLDHIHHRGQFSVYLRMAGSKVPSIYGPTADEPWM
jgi:uncharacterized damage-inducible protein DinB